MKFGAVISFALMAGCADNCPLDIGDRVKRSGSGMNGTVIDIGAGGWTKRCSVAVRHDDGTFSNRGGVIYSQYDVDPVYVPNRFYEKMEHNK